MKKIISLNLLAAILLSVGVSASTKDENRVKTAEQAFKEKRYSDAKAIFSELKGKSEYRSKSLLYLAMINYETGQVEIALAGLDEFMRYADNRKDASLLGAAENLATEIATDYGLLDMAIFDGSGARAIDPGYYSLTFGSQGGLSPAQEARIKIINRILAQSQGILSWKSDGSFLNGKIRYFPIKLYDTTPFTAEVNGISLLFRFDFQTLQGLWISNDILNRDSLMTAAHTIPENIELDHNQLNPSKKTDSKYLIIGGAAAAILATVAVFTF